MTVEIGTYTDVDFDRKEVPLWMFLNYLQLAAEQNETEGASSDGTDFPRMYLAQHNLLPELESLVRTPAICDTFGGADLYRCNMWMGPSHTASPLHYDPFHNLLTQVSGSKYVRLHAPAQTAGLYPYDNETQQPGTHMMVRSNTSQVDCRDVDASAFPEYEKQPYLEVLLHSGDSLYIPDRWWHFCEARGGSASFSVNHWWL